MRKKFIRVMFFGALVLATSASFVACSDYDDDINALNTKVDAINQTLSSLQSQIGSYVKSVSYDPATGVLTQELYLQSATDANTSRIHS